MTFKDSMRSEFNRCIRIVAQNAKTVFVFWKNQEIIGHVQVVPLYFPNYFSCVRRIYNRYQVTQQYHFIVQIARITAHYIRIV